MSAHRARQSEQQRQPKPKPKPQPQPQSQSQSQSQQSLSHSLRNCSNQSLGNSRSPAPSSSLPGTFPRLAGEVNLQGRLLAESSWPCYVFALSLLRRMRSEWGPYAAAKWRRKGPQGGSQGCEPVGCQSRDGLSANPRSRFAQSQGRSPETAASGWPFSWLLLFGHSKRSDSLAGRRVNTRQGCRAPQARAPRKTDITSPGGK